MEIKEILTVFGISKSKNIEQIHANAWNIDDKYILKKSFNQDELKKSARLGDLLHSENIAVPEYLKADDGKTCVQMDDSYYVLMKKINGQHFDAFVGDAFKNGVLLGGLVANLHMALKNIEEKVECCDADYMADFYNYIMKNLNAKSIVVESEIVDYCYNFDLLYKTLPRQLIHRDLHCANMLFEDECFAAFLDFDMSQKNIRLHDICYLGATLLVDNYRDEARVHIWCDIFLGILKGYNKKISLTENEICAIPYTFVFIEMIFAAFFAEIGEIETSKSCIEMVRWLFDNKKFIAELIAKG